MRRSLLSLLLTSLFLAQPTAANADAPEDVLTLMDVFELEYVSNPRISPDGTKIVYARNFMDIMKDRKRSDLWIISFDGSGNRPLLTGVNASNPRWSPDGTRLAYTAKGEHDRTELFVRYMDDGATLRVAQLQKSPGGLAWSPDGETLAFTLFVKEEDKPLVKLPKAPEGADWAEPPKVIDSVYYRTDGRGFWKSGYRHIFVVPAEGGTPRQITTGPYHHNRTPSWSADSERLYFSANRRNDWELNPRESEVYVVEVKSGEISQLTERVGPDSSPTVSPDGSLVAYLGFDDQRKGFQTGRLYLMNADGGDIREALPEFDREVNDPQWAADGSGLFFSYDDEGQSKIAFTALDGEITDLTARLGGTSLGRPYPSGSFTVGGGGRLAFTYTTPYHPADLAVGRRGDNDSIKRLTELNADILSHKTLGEVQEIWFESAADERPVQGWIIRPPHFDPAKKYPLILEIHGGPFLNYGDRFTTELQFYAASGYVVLYINPRGSTSYGEAFANLIHHNYPGEDYDDLMSGVDAAIAQGYVDPDRLFVTGGSGGGILSAWIVGQTNRFKAAVVAKPIINWGSFTLTADHYSYFTQYWFEKMPWEEPERYWERSPLAYVGNVTTPTMLLTGEDDLRTPISESEQFYNALQMLRVPSAMVRVPGASHGITARPSHLMAKIAYVLAWFDKYNAVNGNAEPGGTSAE